MQTRSETAYNNGVLYEVQIDFDNASKLWQENKKSIGNGTYKYICTCITKNGKKCGNVTWKTEEYCRMHYKSA